MKDLYIVAVLPVVLAFPIVARLKQQAFTSTIVEEKGKEAGWGLNANQKRYIVSQ
jgi:hypothetical protein